MQNKWLEYWKKNLKDSLITNIDLEKSAYFEIENYNFQNEVRSKIEEVNRLIDLEEIKLNKKNGFTKKESEEWIILDSTQIIISPLKLVPKRNTSVFTNNQNSIIPFWFNAIIDRNGKLSVPEETFPIIPRKFLDPIADERYEYIFSSLDKVDEEVTIGFEVFDNFVDYTEYIKTIFNNLTGQKIEEYTVDDFKTNYNSIFLIPAEEVNAAISIIELYEKILWLEPLPKLLSKFIDLENEEENEPLPVSQFISANSLHLGQMGYEFPLSISQRKGLLTYLSEKNDIFAINGPPGTGKTTLLQTIVANEIVKSAIEGLDPTIILACSSNNQAVTNILDCFSKSNTREGKLKGRWLPDLDGYATYLPASGKTESELEGLNFKKLRGDGLFQRLEENDYIIKAKEYFISKFSEYNSSTESNIDLCINQLRNQIIEIQGLLKRSTELWVKYNEHKELYFLNFQDINNTAHSYFKDSILDDLKLKGQSYELRSLETNVITYFSKESFFQIILCFLGFKSALSNREAELRIILRNSNFHFQDLKNYSKHEILNQIDKKILLIEETIKAIAEWKLFKNENDIIGNPPADEAECWNLEKKKINNAPNYFYDELDVSLRHKAFQLSLHYWEGRWIIETESNLLQQNNNKGKLASKNRWIRHAMLTPCFVSTFYMAPKFFSYSRFLGKRDDGSSIWDNGPLYDFIDILIVEEAGQVPPEIGSAIFSLAKKAIVIGDSKQIEPIWNTNNKIDIGNLKKIGLIESYEDLKFEELYDPKGFLSSTGSIMKMAQNACKFREKNIPEKGVMLVEHRRCYDEIINYCNALAYHGKLVPLKGKSKPDNLFPPMFCIHVEGNSTTNNKSRFNEMEVNEIVKWLKFNKEKIEKEYGEIEESVGIITPFVGQKKLLKKALNDENYDTDKMKIGTVHALQGAERHIIIFSMVYGKGDVSTMFFDRENKPNMLNVAVSRAKESFIVFANTEIFDKTANTPSGLLSNYLEYQN